MVTQGIVNEIRAKESPVAEEADKVRTAECELKIYSPRKARGSVRPLQSGIKSLYFQTT